MHSPTRAIGSALPRGELRRRSAHEHPREAAPTLPGLHPDRRTELSQEYRATVRGNRGGPVVRGEFLALREFSTALPWRAKNARGSYAYCRVADRCDGP